MKNLLQTAKDGGLRRLTFLDRDVIHVIRLTFKPRPQFSLEITSVDHVGRGGASQIVLGVESCC